MRILQIIPTLNTGGAEKLCVELCSGLAKNNKVTICVIGAIDKRSHIYKMLCNKVNLICLEKGLGFKFIILITILNLILKIKPNVVHFHGRSLFYSSLAIFFYQANYFYTVHNTAVGDEPNKLVRKWYKTLFRFFKVHPISISSKIAKTVQVEYQTKFNTIIHNGINKMTRTNRFGKVKKEIDQIKNDKETIIFLNLARIFPQKNQLMLVRVFNRLIDDGLNIKISPDPELSDASLNPPLFILKTV